MSEFRNAKNNTEFQFDFCWVIAMRVEAAPLIEAFDMKILENNHYFQFMPISKQVMLLLYPVWDQ